MITPCTDPSSRVGTFIGEEKLDKSQDFNEVEILLQLDNNPGERISFNGNNVNESFKRNIFESRNIEDLVRENI